MVGRFWNFSGEEEAVISCLHSRAYFNPTEIASETSKEVPLPIGFLSNASYNPHEQVSGRARPLIFGVQRNLLPAQASRLL